MVRLYFSATFMDVDMEDPQWLDPVDGFHPSDAGRDYISWLWTQALSEALQYLKLKVDDAPRQEVDRRSN